MPPVSAYPVKLGRLALPALIAPKDSYGDGLEAVGAALVAAERRPRPLELELHLYGDAAEADPKLVGDRLRRQAQGLLENARARLEGLWLTFEADPLLDSLLVIGGGELAIDDPSLVLGDYVLTLTDVYRVAKAQTHRPARRIDLRDLRLATTARDAKRTRYGTSFSTFAIPAGDGVVALPTGATDVAQGLAALTPAGARPSLHGDSTVPLFRADLLLPGAVASFEQAAADRGKGDVVLYDRRGVFPSNAATGEPGRAPAGVVVPAYSAAGDRAPASAYGWEEVFGADHPRYDPLDPPVLENGVCRVRYAGASSAFGYFIVEGYNADAGAYRPAYGIAAGRTGAAFGAMLSTSVIEWTPERAVIRITLRGNTAADSSRAEVYVTLERGWTGPQVELYLSVGYGAAAEAGLLWAFNVYGRNNVELVKSLTARAGAGLAAAALSSADPGWNAAGPALGAPPATAPYLVNLVEGDIAAFPSAPIVDSFTRADGVLAPWTLAYGDPSTWTVQGGRLVYLNADTQPWAGVKAPGHDPADREVYFTVADRPDPDGAYHYLVVEVHNDAGMVTLEWEQRPDGTAGIVAKQDTGSGKATVAGTDFVLPSLEPGDGLGVRILGSKVTTWHRSGAGGWQQGGAGSLTGALTTAVGFDVVLTTDMALELDDFGGGAYVAPANSAGAHPFALAIAPLETIATVKSSTTLVSFSAAGAPSITPGSYDATRLEGAVPAAGLPAYLGARFGLTQPGAVIEAEPYRFASGTTAQAADANARGGQAVTDTQATAAADTLRISDAQRIALGLVDGTYRVLARVKADAATTVALALTPSSGAVPAVVGGITQTAYGWLDLGEVSSAAGLSYALRAYHTAGAGVPSIDRLAFIPLERATIAASGVITGRRDGARELAADTLRPARPTPTVVAR